MVSSIFALWWAVPKLSAKNRQKSEAKVKFSKFQSVTISLIMKISRPSVLHLIDLERLFPMLLPFCTVMRGSKVIIRKPKKLKLEVKFSKFQSVTFSLIMKISRPNVLRLIDLEKVFAMVLSFLHCNERFQSYRQKTQKNWSCKSHNNEDMEKYQVIKPCPLLKLSF